MAGFFSDEEDGGNKDEFASVEDLAKETVADTPKPEPKTADNTPNEYRGKSIEQIIEMHQNATKLIGKHSEEVGFAREMARKAAERLQQSDMGSQQRTDADPGESDADFFAKPKQTVEKTISEHPDVIAAKRYAQESAAEKAYSTLKEKLGQDPKEVVNDPEFVNWMQENPFRQQALVHANNTNDTNAAYEVLRNFRRDKADKASESSKTQDQLKQKTTADKKAVMVDAGVPGMPDNGRNYRASELRHLQRTNPDLYERMEAQVMKAYAEGRVKFD